MPTVNKLRNLKLVRRMVFILFVFLIGWRMGLSSAIPSVAVHAQPSQVEADSDDLWQPDQEHPPSIAPSIPPNVDSPVFLPVLNSLWKNDVCESLIHVQYIGCEPTKALLFVWGEPGFCEPHSAGGLYVKCSGLMRPGGSWTFLGSRLPGETRTGVVFRLSGRLTTELPGNPGRTLAEDIQDYGVLADYICELMFFSVLGSPSEYPSLRKAYEQGLPWHKIPMHIARSSGSIAVSVQRDCLPDSPGPNLRSSYRGLTPIDVGIGSHKGSQHNTYFVPSVRAASDGRTSIIYAQNASINECTSIELWIKEQGECSQARLCTLDAFPEGEALVYDLGECAGPDWKGSAWIRSVTPLAIAVDTLSPNTLATYHIESHPSRNLYDQVLEPKKFSARFSPLGYYLGPLVFSEFEGWDTSLQIMNESRSRSARVRVAFIDPSGDMRALIHDWICPLGSQEFRLDLIAGLPSEWQGSVRVDSLSSPSSAEPNSHEEVWAPLSAIVQLDRTSDAARTEANQSVQYRLDSVGGAQDYGFAFDRGKDDASVRRIAVPRLKSRWGDDRSSSLLSISNASPRPGFTDFGVYLYDENSFVAIICGTAATGQSVSYDLRSWGFLSRGFRGAAVISANYWEHYVPDGPSEPNREAQLALGPHLSALVFERPFLEQGIAATSDRASAFPGRPFTLARPNSGQEIELDGWCEPSLLPQCPGPSAHP